MSMEHNTFRLPVGTDNSSDQLGSPSANSKPYMRGAYDSALRRFAHEVLTPMVERTVG
jgi:hypothetical protein